MDHSFKFLTSKEKATATEYYKNENNRTADHLTSCDRYPPLFYQASIITGACDMPDSFAIKVSYVALFYIYCGDLTVVLSSLYFSLEHIFIGESLHK